MLGDKSLSHRALLFAALAEGVSTIYGLLHADDCLATRGALECLGVRIDDAGINEIRVYGVGKYGLKKPSQPIDCGNSGTTMRLLAGLLAAQPFDSVLLGDRSLLKRPMDRIRRPLELMGAHTRLMNGHAPIRIRPCKRLQGITYTMPEASAQVKSCLLLAGLYAEGETTLIESHPTRDHTERMLRTFSYPLRSNNNRISINSTHSLQPTTIEIPGDISSAAFFIVAATLIKGSNLIIQGVGVNPTRLGVVSILKQMGAKIDFLNQRYMGEEPVADIQIVSAPLKGIVIPPVLVPLAIDEFPILMVAAAMAQGETVVRGAGELRLKESDRITAMVEGLHALGIQAHALDDGVVIQGGSFSGGAVASHGDHRIAMAFAVAGALSCEPVTVYDCHNVRTSFPTFTKVAAELQWRINE